jgi:hypothetical protein
VTDQEKTIGLVFLGAIVVLAILVAIARASKNAGSDHIRLPPVQIAKIVDPGTAGGAGVGGVALLLFTVYCLFKYFAAETLNEQIVALLLWIGNGVFWGSLTIAAVISGGKTSIVYRDQVAAERQEPRL